MVSAWRLDCTMRVDLGEDAVDQVRGPLGDEAPSTTRTEGPPLARKRHEPIDAARSTLKSREPSGQPSAAQKVAELLLDEPRQAFSVAQTGCLCAKGLEVIDHDLVERALRGTPRFVARGGPDHWVP